MPLSPAITSAKRVGVVQVAVRQAIEERNGGHRGRDAKCFLDAGPIVPKEVDR